MLLVADVIRPRKYRVGMSLEEVLQIADSQKLELHESSLELEGVSETILNAQVASWLYDKNCGLLVEFNHKKIVLNVQKWKYLGIDFASLFHRLND